MDEDIIEDIADAFAKQLENVSFFPLHAGQYYEAAVLDDIVCMAIVINNHAPTYDLRYFYKRAGFPEPYPEHPMQF